MKHLEHAHDPQPRSAHRSAGWRRYGLDNQRPGCLGSQYDLPAATGLTCRDRADRSRRPDRRWPRAGRAWRAATSWLFQAEGLHLALAVAGTKQRADRDHPRASAGHRYRFVDPHEHEVEVAQQREVRLVRSGAAGRAQDASVDPSTERQPYAICTRGPACAPPHPCRRARRSRVCS